MEEKDWATGDTRVNGFIVYLKIYSNEDVEVINEVQNANNIQILKEDLKVNSLIGQGNTKISAKDIDIIRKISYHSSEIQEKVKAMVDARKLANKNKLQQSINKIRSRG